MNFSRVLLRVPHFAGKAGSLEIAWFTSPLERLSAAIVKSLEHLGIHSTASEIALAHDLMSMDSLTDSGRSSSGTSLTFPGRD